MSGQELEIITPDGEVITGVSTTPLSTQPQSLAVNLARAEIDQQIATARAMPRSVARAVSNITMLATLDAESAEECIYALPRGGKPIKGPSVRLAEIIASQWGNNRVGARVVHVDKYEKYIEAEGVFHDLESNSATTARVRRSISDKQGRVFKDDMIVVAGNAACAIAKRNAILGAVPKGVWRKAYNEVEKVLAGETKTLAERRDRAFKALAAFGVTPEMIFTSLEIGGQEELTTAHMATLTGMREALKNGEATVEEMFPKPKPQGEAPKSLNEALDRVASGGASAKAEPQERPAGGEPENKPKDEAPASAPPVKLDHVPTGIDGRDEAQVRAYAAGLEAAKKGHARRAVPGEYRNTGREAEAAAWERGHDFVTTSRKAEKEGGAQ